MSTVTPSWANAATVTITLASLASSSGLTAGREAAAVDNSTNKYDDVHLSGKITVGTSPTVGQIKVFIAQAFDETPTWPGVITGSDAACTLNSAVASRSYLKLAAVIDVDTTTSDRAYPFDVPSVADLCGGAMPRNWTVFVVHNTVAALNATAGNHVVKYVGIKYDIA